MKKGLLLYLNIPFCPEKCGYCSKEVYGISRCQSFLPEFLPAMERELCSAASDLEDHTVKAVWIGGGIAGHIFDRELGNLIRRLPKLFSMEEDAEITLKVHPGMVSAETLHTCDRAGINRLSIEYVTSIKTEYQTLGRFLDPDAMRITDLVLAPSHLERSYDVLVGIPGQSAASLRQTLSTAIGYRADHFSFYRLESETPEKTDELMAFAGSWLGEKGFSQYLPGHFARPGHTCRYHQYMDEQMEYLGFGPGAESFLDGIHSRNTSSLSAYLQHSGEPELLITKMWN
jgi:oxygen-independent coproporphyrinogen-3 oxidase